MLLLALRCKDDNRYHVMCYYLSSVKKRGPEINVGIGWKRISRHLGLPLFLAHQPCAVSKQSTVQLKNHKKKSHSSQ